MTIATDIQELYVAFFNRPADAPGLAYWSAQAAQNGGSVAAVANAFSASAEYQAVFSGLTRAESINQVYLNLFGRPAEPAGLAFWSTAIDNGLPLSTIAQSIANGAQNADFTSLHNKVVYAVDFTNAASDSAAEISGYSGAGPNAIARSQLLAITDDASLAAAVSHIDANVAAAIGVHNVPVSGPAYLLTTGVDTITGTSGDDLLVGTIGSVSNVPTLNTGDAVDGGGGQNTLAISDFGSGILPAGITLAHIQTLNVTSTGANAMDVSGIAGLAAFNVVGSNGADTITAASTTAVSVNDGAVGTGDVVVDGGANVTLNVTGITTSIGTAITVGGTTAATGNVSITAATGAYGHAGTIAATINGGTAVTIANTLDSTAVGGAENVVDAAAGPTNAGTLSSVSLSGYGSASTITANALSSLSLTNGSSNVSINNSLTKQANTTLALTVSNVTGGTLVDANNEITTLNITTAGGKNGQGGALDSTLANISDSQLTTLTVSGTNLLTLTSTAGMSALQTVIVSGGASLHADFSALATLTDLNEAGATGASTLSLGTATSFEGGASGDTLTIGATTAAIALGAGADTVILNASALGKSGTIDGGGGTDTLVMTGANAQAASATSTFATGVTGFEHLTLTNVTNQTVDVAMLGNYNVVSTSGGNGLTLSNMASGGTLVLTNAGSGYTIANNAFASGNADLLHVALTSAGGAGVAFASTGLTASDVETIAITTADTQATPSGTFNDTFTLLGNSANTITVAGDAGLTLTAADTAATTIDASGITLGGFNFTSGNLAAVAAIKGSASGANTVDFSAATNAVTYTGGSGVDTVILGTGDNVVSTGAGANYIRGTSGNQTVTVGNTDGSVISITGAGNNHITVGSGSSSVTVGSGQNQVSFAAHAAGKVDSVQLGTAASSTAYSVVSGLQNGDSLSFGTDTISYRGGTLAAAQITLTAGAAYSDFIAAAVTASTVQGEVSWFQFGGNTFVVEQHSASGTTAFQNGSDNVVELSGTPDLTAVGALGVTGAASSFTGTYSDVGVGAGNTFSAARAISFVGLASGNSINIDPYAINTPSTLDDNSFGNGSISNIEHLNFNTIGTGNFSLTTGAHFAADFNTVDLTAVTTTGTMTLNLGAYVAAATIDATTTTGTQNITLGTASGTAADSVTAHATTGTIGITVGDGADTVSATSTTGAINITAGDGADTITANGSAGGSIVNVTTGLGIDSVTVNTVDAVTITSHSITGDTLLSGTSSISAALTITANGVATSGTYNIVANAAGGAETIDVSGGIGTQVYNITLGTHSSAATILVSEIGTGAQANSGTYAPNTIITGAHAGDVIQLRDINGHLSVDNGTAASVELGVEFGHTGGSAGMVSSFNFAGNTYLVEDVVGATPAATSTVIELVGIHTITSVIGGAVTLAT